MNLPGNLSVWHKIAFSAKLRLIQRRGTQITGLTVKKMHFGGENSAVKGLSRLTYFVSYKFYGQGPVSRNPRKLKFGPLKPFLVHLYLKPEKCIPLERVVLKEHLFILRLCE